MESLTELHAFRNDMIARCKDPANRLRRPDGKLGPVRLGARRGLLRDLLSMQERLGASLIAREEVAAIRREWKKRTWRNENALFSSGKKRSVKE
jgi:hypothetical protein